MEVWGQSYIIHFTNLINRDLGMARQLRIEYERGFYHITSRGNQREKIFWDAKDRERLKTILERTKERYGYLLHAYVFMDNHYHLLIETPRANLHPIMQNAYSAESSRLFRPKAATCSD